VSEQQKTQKIEELTKKLPALKEQIDRINVEARECAGKRNGLNEQCKSLRAQILELKNERDKLNAIVKEQKQQRNDTRTKIREKIEESRKLNPEIKALTKKKPSRSLQTLQTEFESIEWKIQTTTLSLQEEKKLIGQVKQLETQLNVFRRLDKLNQANIEVRAELKALETQRDLCHEKLTTTAEKSQEVHGKMLEKIGELNKLKIEADNLHKLFLRTRERAKPLEEETKEILEQIRLLRREIREAEETEKKVSEEALREKLEKQAREKLKRGEKLTWEEFQLLAENETEAQD